MNLSFSFITSSDEMQVMLDVKCCGVHGGEIDYQGRQQPAECVKAASIIGR